MLWVRESGTPKLRAGPVLELDDGPALAHRVRFQPSLLSRDEARNRLIVPSVRISSVVMPLREETEGGSIELVGVRECEDEFDEPDWRLKERKKERPFDFGQAVLLSPEVGEEVDLAGGRVGGRQMGIEAGEAGSELDASLFVVLVMEAGVVEPDVEGSMKSLLRFEDATKLLNVGMSEFGASTA